MIKRCYNPNCKDYSFYGARGVRVCKRWRDSFLNFLEDMGLRKGLTLDRYPDKNGDYKPNNCRWATMKQQSNNRRSRRSRAELRGTDAGFIEKQDFIIRPPHEQEEPDFEV